MPAILIECCFIDNKLDMDRYNAEKMANAIVQGLVGELRERKISGEGSFLEHFAIATIKQDGKD